MALTLDDIKLRALVPGGHFPKRSGREKIRISASDDEQRDVAQTIESRPERGKRLFEIETFERLHQIAIVSLANASHRIGEGYSGVIFPIGLAQTVETLAHRFLEEIDGIRQRTWLRQPADVAADASHAARLQNRANVVQDGPAHDRRARSGKQH